MHVCTGKTSKMIACTTQLELQKNNNEALLYLIERADGRNKDDGIGIVKIRNPGMTLSTSTTDVKQMPRHCFPVNIEVKHMLRYSHGLNASMENVVWRGKLSICG